MVAIYDYVFFFSVCKSCLVKHLEERNTCPNCDIVIHQSHPLNYISFDRTMQDIVFKLVPNLQPGMFIATWVQKIFFFMEPDFFFHLGKSEGFFTFHIKTYKNTYRENEIHRSWMPDTIHELINISFVKTKNYHNNF